MIDCPEQQPLEGKVVYQARYPLIDRPKWLLYEDHELKSFLTFCFDNYMATNLYTTHRNLSDF